jgi:hypothetical protein
MYSFLRSPMLFAAAVLLCPIVSVGQVIVDATVPVHERLRNPTAGHSGSFGRELPVTVALEVPAGGAELNFVLTNTGTTPLIVPVSVHPGDLEPANPAIPYTVQALHLFLSSGSKETAILPTGKADLYGSETTPQTLVKLLPNESLQVLTCLMPDEIRAKGTTFVAHAILESETVKTIRGDTTEDSQEIGSSQSPIYTFNSLFPFSED